MARVAIPKTVRFEVFKRDRFTCQYCGASAPDVLLEVDHIKPVSKGGTNEMLNLITACRDCNRGKTNKTLSDDSAVKAQKRQLDMMQERREQLKMMLEWKSELFEEEETEIDAIDDFIGRMTNGSRQLTDAGRRRTRDFIKRFGFNEVYESAEIAFAKYYTGSIESVGYAFDKIGGVCYNRRKAKEAANAKQDH